MDTLILTMPRQQALGFFLRLGLSFAALSALLITVLDADPMCYLLNAPLTLGLVLLMGLGGRSTLTSTGIEVRYLFLIRRWYAWGQIAVIREETQGRTAELRAHLVGGGSVTLAVPTSSAIAPHPAFSAARDKVIAFWQRYGHTSHLL